MRPRACRAGRSVYWLVAFELYAEREDTRDLGVEHLAREAVGGDAVAHHAAGLGGLLAQRYVVAAQREVVGG